MSLNEFCFKKNKTFIIAEIGVNHNGSVTLAKKQILAARRAGADCVKFQSFKASEVASDDAPKAVYQLINTDSSVSQVDMLKNLELNSDQIFELFEYCEKLEIKFFSTPYNYEDAVVLKKLNVKCLKLASMHCGEPVVIKEIASLGLPIILSTGMCNISEVRHAVQLLNSLDADFALLHCTSDYPCRSDEVNLRVLDTFANLGSFPIGFSDHTTGVIASVSAVAKGARIIEKHFTLDKSLPGPDHSTSLEPDEFQKMVELIREVEIMRGSTDKKITEAEQKNINGMRRSLVYKNELAVGAIIQRSDLIFKRPYNGIPVSDINAVLGRQIVRQCHKDTFVNLDDFH